MAVTEFEPANEGQFETGLHQLAQAGHDPIVLIGFAQAAALKKVAPGYPSTRFTIIDASVDLPNVRSVLFKEQESTFLVGMAAALASKTGKVGFVGGMESPLMSRFACGYEQGAKYANPRVEVIADMAGKTPAAWNDPATGTRLANGQFARGVERSACRRQDHRGGRRTCEPSRHLAECVERDRRASCRERV